MSEDLDFDREVDAAWNTFCVRLGTYLGAMNAGDVLTVCPGGGVRRDSLYLTVTWQPDAHRVAAASIDGALARAMAPVEVLGLAAHGWQEHLSGDASRRDFRISGDADVVAHAVVVLIRDYRGVAHPSFLAASSVGAPVNAVFDCGSVSPDWAVDTAVSTLVDDIDRALESITGTTPERDEDGDIVFENDGHSAYLRILDTETVAEIITVFAIHPGTHTANALVSTLTQEWPDIKFQFNETHVVASTRIDCAPLVEEHLGRRLGMFLRFVAERANDIVAELSSRDTLPPELLTLIHLLADPIEQLTPQDVAQICNDDRDSILDMMKICSDEGFAQQFDSTVSQNDSEDLFLRGAGVWQRAEHALRGALRFIVLTLPRNPRG